jgi:hypothetical protein
VRRRLTGLALALPGLAPAPAWACAVCIDWAGGSRGFPWPYALLMAAPFVVAAALAVAIGRGCGEPSEGDRPDASP